MHEPPWEAIPPEEAARLWRELDDLMRRLNELHSWISNPHRAKAMVPVLRELLESQEDNS